MADHPAKRSLEDVLDAFIMEDDHGRKTVQRYVRDFPEYAADIVDLSRELLRPLPHRTEPLSPTDNQFIDESWQMHAAAKASRAADIIASLSPKESRVIANLLGIPLQVMTCFRERTVLVASIPRQFVNNFAAALKVTAEELKNALANAAPSTPARSYKSVSKPCGTEPVTFERILIDAGVSDTDRARLLDDGN